MIQVAIVTISDSAVAGTRKDRSGPKLRERAEALGWSIGAQELVPDETAQISALLRRLADSPGISVILTTGGTGVAQYWLTVGTTAGGNNVYTQDQGTNLSAAVMGLPTTGSTIYVRLWSLADGTWQYHDYIYTAAQ